MSGPFGAQRATRERDRERVYGERGLLGRIRDERQKVIGGQIPSGGGGDGNASRSHAERQSPLVSIGDAIRETESLPPERSGVVLIQSVARPSELVFISR